MISEDEKKQYNDYVKQITPNNSLPKDMLNAFWIGGLICLIGQIFLSVYKYWGMSQDNAAYWTSITLIFLSVLLTGLGVYPKIAKYGGAGTLVPITGFANGVASSAIEFRMEGEVLGLGAKIFTIAGPVILYGILSSWIVGIIYLIMNAF